MILTARIARRIGGAEPGASDAFGVGLIHDVGLAALALGHGTAVEDVRRCARAEGRPAHVAEREGFGVSHAEVGAHLLALWGLPLHVVEAVAHHHTPSLAARDRFGTLEVVHVASSLAERMLCPPGALAPLEIAHLGALGVAERLPAWQAVAEEELRGCGLRG